ncbi:Protein of unknown function [Luteibacter sp. UNC138MFCol5.1]|uniref:tail completion protein gp17 n=1 Tax=Luteibacter sp. UNC138MFCol5.1 TaxID=1502774 RepID=UPI0008AD3DE1|nr:DUF3168 domain-containing protein [Luteibacter sp. UNC138MFCol5.1]SEO63417.1 Protein of unknown function [Luteibacter sp. UNC138MFCol5.1]
MLEETLYALLAPLAAGGASPDVTEDNPVFPCITYQQVGGETYQYVEKTLPDHRHARVQINVHAMTRIDAATIARSIERAIIESPLVAQAYGAFVSTYEDTLKIYGTRQDFGIWVKE